MMQSGQAVLTADAVLWLQIVNLFCTTAVTLVTAILLQARHQADRRAEIRHAELRVELAKQGVKLEDALNGAPSLGSAKTAHKNPPVD